jgi:hypothetical protein
MSEDERYEKCMEQVRKTVSEFYPPTQTGITEYQSALRGMADELRTMASAD